MTRMTRIWTLAALLAVITALLGGCWSRHELNELSIVAGIAIDKAGDKYKVTTQIVNPSRVIASTGASGNESPVIAFQETGTTIAEALRRMILTSPRQLYFAHLRMLVFGENVAKEGIAQSLDFLSRNAKTRTDFYIVVSKGTSASDILQIHSRLDPIPTSSLHTMLRTSDTLWAATTKVTLDDLVQELSTPERGTTLTGVQIRGDKAVRDKSDYDNVILAPVELSYAGMAVFRNDRMIGWLNENDSKAVNYIDGDVKRTVGKLKCPKGDGYTSLEVFQARSSIDVENRDGLPAFTVNVRVEQNITDVECHSDMTKPSFIEWLNKEGIATLHEMLTETLQRSQRELRNDYIGFCEVVHRKQPKLWHAIREDWDNIYPDVPIELNIQVFTRKAGSTSQSIQYKMVQ